MWRSMVAAAASLKNELNSRAEEEEALRGGGGGGSGGSGGGDGGGGGDDEGRKVNRRCSIRSPCRLLLPPSSHPLMVPFTHLSLKT